MHVGRNKAVDFSRTSMPLWYLFAANIWIKYEDSMKLFQHEETKMSRQHMAGESLYYLLVKFTFLLLMLSDRYFELLLQF